MKKMLMRNIESFLTLIAYLGVCNVIVKWINEANNNNPLFQHWNVTSLMICLMFIRFNNMHLKNESESSKEGN